MFRRGKYPSRGGYDSLPAPGEGVEMKMLRGGWGSSGLGGRVPPHGAVGMVAQVSGARVDDNSV